MSSVSPVTAPPLAPEVRHGRRDLQVGTALVAIGLAVALAASILAPGDPAALGPVGQSLRPPGSDHLLGTDTLGRDVLGRLIHGGRASLLVGWASTALAVALGAVVGLAAGLGSRRLQRLLTAVIDLFLALPGILPLLVLITVFGTGGEVLLPTLAFFFGIPVIRVARAAAHEVVARDFVSAARARGQSRPDIVRREILPNVTDTLLVEGAMRWSWMLLGFSSLSFLGFGVSPPTPDWGLMVSDARIYMSLAPWGVIAPVVALSTLIVGINLTADALAKTLGLDRSRKAVI